MCAACGHQASVIAGTIFQGTRTPLSVWFRAIWWVVSQKNGASALGLQRVLGLGSYRTAWTWLHKLRRAMVRPGRDRVSEEVEVDETLVGGLEAGGGRRHLGKKALVVIAAEVRGRAIGRIRMQRVADASADSLLTFVQHAVQPGSVVITDGLQSYRRLPKRGYRHDRRVLLGRGESAEAVSCLASTGSRRSSSAGSWVRIRAASVASISTITATSSPFGSIDEPHAIAGSSSIGSWNRPWRWFPFPTRRWSRVSVVGRRNATTTGSRDLSKGNTPMGRSPRARTAGPKRRICGTCRPPAQRRRKVRPACQGCSARSRRGCIRNQKPPWPGCCLRPSVRMPYCVLRGAKEVSPMRCITGEHSSRGRSSRATRLIGALIALLIVSAPRLAQEPVRSAAADWPTYNRDLAGTRYSPLDQINTRECD